MLRESRSERCFADDVAEATGLAPMFADGVIERCCKRAGVARAALQPRDLEALLPHLESSLLVYKTGREVLAALDRLRRLATKPPSKSGRPKQSFIRARSELTTEHEPFALQRRIGSH